MLSALKMHKCIYFKLCALKAEYRSIGDIKHSSDFLKNIINIFVYDLFKMFVWHTECCHSLKWMLTKWMLLTNILKMRVYNDRDCPHWHVLDCCRESRGQNMRAESQTELFKFMTRLMHRPRSLSHCQCVFGFFFPWNSILIALISAVKGDRTHTHSLCFHIIISFHINILLTECFL